MTKLRVTAPSTLSVWVSAVGVFAGCVGSLVPESTGTGGSTGRPSSGGITSSGSGGATSAGSGGTTGSIAVASDLPCDVAALLAGKCSSCHGSQPSGGAPMSLVNQAELTAPAISDPTKTNAAVAVARMMNTVSPMPPLGLPAATSAEIASLQSWISAGYPSGGCATTVDAGGAPDPFSVAPTCTSGKSWTGGTNGSNSMQPGVACISCHASTGGEAPLFTIAGTLYPTGHEPDQCNGANGTDGAQVVVTDAKGVTISLTPNSVGNFSYSGQVAMPFRAKVTYMGRERDMATAQTSGDCNACHTQNGTMSAPGRIILP